MRKEITKVHFPLAEYYMKVMTEAEETIFKKRKTKILIDARPYMYLGYMRNAGRNYNYLLNWAYVIHYSGHVNNISFNHQIYKTKKYVYNVENIEGPINSIILYKLMADIYNAIQTFKEDKISRQIKRKKKLP